MLAAARKAKAREGSKAPPGISLRALARRLGVSHTAVRDAIATGRLKDSVGRFKGQPIVLDPARAVKEWAEGAAKPRPKGTTLVDAQFKLVGERTKALRLANDQKRGRLVEAEVARREAFDCARAVRDALLNLPDRLAAELAAESDPARVYARLDEELRRALETVAEVLADGN